MLQLSILGRNHPKGESAEDQPGTHQVAIIDATMGMSATGAERTRVRSARHHALPNAKSETASNHLALLDRQVAVDEIGADPVGGRLQALHAEPAQPLEHDQPLLAQFVGDDRAGDRLHRARN